MNPFLPASLSSQSLHPPKNQNSPYMKLLIPPNSQFDARRAYLTPTKPTFNIGTTVQSDSMRRDFQKRSSGFQLPFIIDSKQRTRTIQSPLSNGQKNSQFFTFADSPILPRKTSPDRPADLPFGLVTLDKKVFVPEGLLPGVNASDNYYNLGGIADSKSSKRLTTNPNRDSLDVFVDRDGPASPKKTENDSEDEKDNKQTTKRSHKKKSKSPKEKKRRSKRAATLDESQHHVRVDKNMLETVIQTALLGTRLNEQRLEKLEREIQKYGPPPHDERLRSPPSPRKYKYPSKPKSPPSQVHHQFSLALNLYSRERGIITPQQQPSGSGLAEFFDRTRPKYDTTFKTSSRLEARLRGFKVNSYETSVNAEQRSHGKHLTFADEYPNYNRNYDSLGPRDRLGIPIKTEAIDEESRNELYSPYQQDMYYNRRQYNQINDRSYDGQNDDYYHKNSYHDGSKRPLNSLLQDYFARGRDREFPPITDQPTHNSHFNDDGSYPQSQEIGKNIHDSFLKEKEDDEEEEKNAQIKKSVLKQNRRFGVDEAEIARRRKELRIVLWGMTYTRLLSNAVRDYFRKKNKIFQEWFPRTSFNNAGMFQAFLAKHLPTPFMNILKEKKNLQIAGSQGTVKELDQKCKLISEHINNIFTQLLKNLKKEWLPSSFFVFLGSFVQDRSHLPHDYYTNFEIDRLHISRYSALENMKPENIKMLIGAYAIIRVMLCRVMTKPWLTWNQTKPDDFDLMNSFNIASIIYQAFMDVFFNQNPVIPDNQQHLLKNEKVPAVKVRTKAMESGKYPGTDEDEYEGIIVGFYNKEALRAFIKDRPALYAKVVAWANTILDCLLEITKKHFNASSVETKKYYAKLLPH